MSNKTRLPVIRLRGVRHNNLKNFDLDLPLHRLIVITGLSGSGKSSLAFDTLFAEGQRRYIETFSPYARQFFDRMDKPQVDSIEGIPPAIAIEQRNAVRTTRSTVGTMTEICDYMKLLWPHLAQLHCRKCGRPVRKDSPQAIWQTLSNSELGTRNSESSRGGATDSGHSAFRIPHSEFLITFDLPLSEKLPLEESLALVEKQGYQRLLLATAGHDQPADAGLVLREQAYDTLPEVSVDSASGGFQVARIEEAVERLRALKPASVTIVQDRVALKAGNRARFVEACEQAYHFGKGKLAIHAFPEDSGTAPPGRRVTDCGLRITHRFSNRLHCAGCDLEYREPTPALFSFNHPIGACPACRGFGRIISIDYGLAMPDHTRTLAQGVVKPWLTGTGAESQDDLMKFCRKRKVPTDVPFARMSRKLQEWVINGDPDYGKDDRHRWPYLWYGVKGYFRWLESKAYKMHVRVLLSRYRAYTPCPDCGGKRFQPEALLYRMAMENWPLAIGKDQPKEREASSMTLADFYALPIRDALKLVETVAASRHLQTVGSSSPSSASSDPLVLALNEVRSRLGYLAEVGLGYLTLDRPTRSLSGGETERVNLTTCLGTRLVNTLFVLDEPSVGLHPRDTDRLVRILERLRDAGNTVVVVEHEAGVIRAADEVVDLGPEQGERGGEVVFQGTFQELLKDARSLTGQYLSGRRQIPVPARRPVSVAANVSSQLDSPRGARISSRVSMNTATMKIEHATRHNLKDLTVQVPLDRFVCITGVSGSGKTTLVREVLLPALEAKLKLQRTDPPVPKASARMDDSEGGDESDSTLNSELSTHLTGWESLNRVVLVDQSALGKTPRSNPAVYVGAFDSIRELFAQSEPARQRGLNASAFSFNSLQGQCERCRGAGFEKIEMQFLSDVFIRCPDCDGRRYRPHILEVRVSGLESGVLDLGAGGGKTAATTDHGPRTADKSWNIADLLEATVNEVVEFLRGFADSRPAERAIQGLKLLQDVGLGYLRLGQPINTLSGGECQRLKLVRHLADDQTCFQHPAGNPDQTCQSDAGSTLFLFDEPTTGLHFDDVRVLLAVFQRLVEAGHSVVVIEHNLEVIKCADWLIDLGPDAGDEGGEVVAQGTPEQVAACDRSHTGRALRAVLHGAREAQSGKRS